MTIREGRCCDINMKTKVKALIAAREAAYCALTLPSVVKESEESAMGGFTMPTIDLLVQLFGIDRSVRNG